MWSAGLYGFCFRWASGLYWWTTLPGVAGLQVFGGPVSSGSVLLGLVHLTGFVAAIVICFAIGAGLCARGLVSHREHEQDKHRA